MGVSDVVVVNECCRCWSVSSVFGVVLSLCKCRCCQCHFLSLSLGAGAGVFTIGLSLSLGAGASVVSDGLSLSLSLHVGISFSVGDCVGLLLL